MAGMLENATNIDDIFNRTKQKNLVSWTFAVQYSIHYYYYLTVMSIFS